MGAVMLNLVLNWKVKGTIARFDFLINPSPLLYTDLKNQLNIFKDKRYAPLR